MSGATISSTGVSVSGLLAQRPDEAETDVFRELSIPVRLVRRVLLLPATLVLLLAYLRLDSEHDPVGFALLVGSVVMALWWAARGWVANPKEEVTLPRLMRMLFVAFTVQTLIIVFTGGIESPFIVIYVPLLVFTAVSIGRRRIFWLAFLLPLTSVAVLEIAFATGHRLRPAFLDNPITYSVLVGAAVLLVIVLGGNLGLAVRNALDRVRQVAERARSQRFDMVVERNRELMQLAGSIAHELKNPLTAIQGLAMVVARKLPPESREAEQMSVVVSEVKRMGSIVEEFLNFSRPSQSLTLETVAASALIDDIVTMHEPYAGHRGVAFRVTVADDPLLFCDPRKMKQVLVNLVQNALDATPEGSWVAIYVRTTPPDEVEFTIDDNGPGLASQIQGRLFMPGHTTKAAGTGLGLTIARAITHQHGGELSLEDRPEGGCRATLRLPLSQAPTGAEATP